MVESSIEGTKFTFLSDDIRSTLDDNMINIDRELTAAAQKEEKYVVFKKWLLDNGAVFEDTVEFPCVFRNGLMGIAAKKDLPLNKAFLFVPNTCIISKKRIEKVPELAKVFEENDSLFGSKHPDTDQLTLTVFLLYNALMGEKSFWWPYLQVMNEADMTGFWPLEQIEAFKDSELKNDAQLYCFEFDIEWVQIEKALSKYEHFEGLTKEVFYKYYNLACTRCFGWNLPDTMMVPLADFLNHLPIDTQFGVYSKRTHQIKSKVDSNEDRKALKRIQDGVEKNIDYSILYRDKAFLEDLEPEVLAKITGTLAEKTVREPRSK